MGAALQPVPDSVVEAVEGVCLPLMPQVLVRFWRMSEDDGVPMDDLARLAGQDPGLAAHVFGAASLRPRSQGGAGASLGQCLEALGRPLVRTMAGCLAIEGVFPRAAGKDGRDLGGFWRHSLLVAELSRALAGRLGRVDAEDAYLAGLLHDVGELLLLGGFGQRYEALLAWSRNEDALLALERPELGIDHAAVGAWLIDRWQLPSFVADAVLFHHHGPGEIGCTDRLCQIVWAAHAMANWPADDVSGIVGAYRFEAAAIEALLGLPADGLADIRDRALARVAEVAAGLEIGVAPGAGSLACPPAATLDLPVPGARADAEAQIAASVRDTAMLQALQRQLPTIDNDRDMLRAVREAARIFFGYGRFAFLLAREDGVSLSSGELAGQPELLRRLDIGLRPGTSLVAAVAASGQPQATFAPDRPADVTLLDMQIARALDCEGVLYLPMRSRERKVGIMAVGLSEGQFRRARMQLPWLENLARLAAQGIEARCEAALREKKLTAELESRFARRARRVAHEAGNPLAIINNYLQVVAERLAGDSGVRQELAVLKEEIDRVARIVRDLSEGTRSPTLPDEVDVNAVIEGMVALYGESLFAPHDIRIELDLDRKIAAIPGNRDQLKQVLLNLWKNAAEAMPDGGRFSVTTAETSGPEGRGEVEIRLTDTGPGLPEDVMRKNFQPLDPHRRPGHAGVGLSIVAGLVKDLAGRISYQSRAGQGTSFVIRLPAFQESEIG